MRSVVLVAAGVILAAMLLVVAINYRPAVEPGPRAADAPITELIVPRGLGGESRSRDDLLAELSAETGWIQTVDEQTGAPAQRYRFDRLHPDPEGYPEGWLAMERPEAQIFLSDRRVLHLSGDTATASAPNRALERGTLTGNVLIRLFETASDRAFEIPDEEPLITVRTDEATFDQQVGRIECIGPVTVQTPTAELAGRGVTVQFNDIDRLVERLRIDALEYVALRSAGDTVGPEEPDAAPDAVSPARVEPRDDRPRQTRPRRAAPSSNDVFYVLTLERDVVVRQGRSGERRTARGDRLSVIFSPRSEGLQGLALRPAADRPARGDAGWSRGLLAGMPPPLPLAALIARLAQGVTSSPPDPADDITIITCTGGVTMTPLRDPTQAPASARHAVLTMTGDPVELDDEGADATASCVRLAYRTRGDRVDLYADDTRPVLLTTPDLVARGERFWLGRRRGAGGFIGGGALHVPSTDPTVEGPPCPELRVTWSGGVDLELARQDDDPQQLRGLRAADFTGDVVVTNDRLRLDGERLRIAMTTADEREATVERITAHRAVVRALGRSGSIRGPLLELALDTDDAGRSSPRRMQMSGGIEAVDQDQHLWAETLDVTFLDRDAAPAARASASVAIGLQGSDVDTLVAEGDVQVLSGDGIRAFADRLDVDAASETGVLSGAEVLVARGDLLMERGTRVEFDAAGGTTRWRGPGRARVLTTPLEVTATSRLARPAVPDDAPATMRASWASSLTYDATVNDDAGGIELFGDVAAELRRTALEHNTLEGQHMTIDLAFADESASASREDRVSGRVVGRFIARHQARLEARTWAAEDPRRKPDVFFVAGDYVEYDDVAGTALVIGEGTLLLRDLDAAPTATASAGDAGAPFGGRGTTMFIFGDQLKLVTTANQQYAVTMTGGVQGSHQAVDGRTAAVTGERFEALFERRTSSEGTGAEPLGGAMDLRRLQGRGAVYIRTDERRVEADEFDYDLISGRAEARSAPGGLVAMETSDGQLVSAERIDWNMVTDEIRIRRTLGSVDRD